MLRLSQLQLTLAVAGTVALAGLFGARPSAADHSNAASAAPGSKGCMAEESVDSIDQLLKDLDDARQSNDIHRMRSALDEARKPLNQMRDCLDLARKQANKDKGKGPVATAVKDLGLLCGYEIDETRAPKAVYQQITYYFCSDNDRADFEKQPTKYLKTSPQNPPQR